MYRIMRGEQCDTVLVNLSAVVPPSWGEPHLGQPLHSVAVSTDSDHNYTESVISVLTRARADSNLTRISLRISVRASSTRYLIVTA